MAGDNAKSWKNNGLLLYAHYLAAGAFEKLMLTDSTIVYARAGLQLARSIQDAEAFKFEYGKDEAVGLFARHLALAYSWQRNADSAFHYFKVFEKSPKWDLWKIRLLYAEILVNLGQYEKAWKYCEEALAYETKRPQHPSLHKLQTLAGFSLLNLGDTDRAEVMFLSALQSFKNAAIRQPNMGGYYFAATAPLQGLASIYLRQNNPEGLFRVAEESRKSHLYKRFFQQEFPVRTLSLRELQQSLRPDEAALQISKAYSNQLFSIAITRDTIVVHHLKDSSIGTLLQQPELSVLADEINMQLQAYVAGVIQTTSWLTNNMKPADYLMPLALQFNEYTGAFRFSRSSIRKTNRINASNTGHLQLLSNFFYQLYIQPFEGIIRNKKQIIVSPGGTAEFVPLEVLRNPGGPYLGAAYELVYAPSFTIWNLLKKSEQPSSNKLLAVGNPDYKEYARYDQNNPGLDLKSIGISSWSDLPGTAVELKGISKINIPKEVLTGQEVSEEKIAARNISGQLSSYNWIHFALHGFSFTNSYKQMGLVVTNGNSNTTGDGYLQYEEIAKLRLKARLVVLSACETALPARSVSDFSYRTLADAFLLGGANSVLASSWKVDDASTATFMNSFYEKMLIKKMTAPAALHATRKEFIQGVHGSTWQAPGYWAAFKYYGF
jgi:CHAT domain-containing protein